MIDHAQSESLDFSKATRTIGGYEARCTFGTMPPHDRQRYLLAL